MNGSKEYLGAFFVGGIYTAIGQLFFMLLSNVVPPESGLTMPLVLISMGLVAFITYTTGIHQKVSAWSGWGSILVFNGFACAVADAFIAGFKNGGLKGGIVSTADLILWVVGTGAMLSVVIGITAFYLM